LKSLNDEARSEKHQIMWVKITASAKMLWPKKNAFPCIFVKT